MLFCVAALEEAAIGRLLQYPSGLAVHQRRVHEHGHVAGRRHPHFKDDRGSWMDNVPIERMWPLKYECVYLDVFETGTQAQSVVRSTINPTEPIRFSPAGRPMRSMLRRLARGNWRRKRTQNLPQPSLQLSRKPGPPLIS